ncbi:lectin subunit alpha-like [Calliphora vicina]|uniref:lectin subunit alpha-like n=1 Tax=Calliphora vicina TaxID=7373 RepID=UPI00325A5231
MEILKRILFLAIIIEIANSIPVDKWQKSEDLPTFFINTENKYNWHEAWNECASRNMSLVAVDTIEKHTALQTVLRKKFAKAPNLWLGGHDLGESGKYIWSSTGKQFDFSNWSNGNPDNYKGLENCAHIWDQTDFEWNDGSCKSKIGYICEENRFVVAARRDFAVKKNFIYQLFEL